MGKVLPFRPREPKPMRLKLRIEKQRPARGVSLRITAEPPKRP